jgi:hypothetical protein
MRALRALFFSYVLTVLSISASAQADVTEPALPEFSSLSGRSSEIELGTPIHVVNPVLPKKLRNRELVAVLQATVEKDGSLDDLGIAGGDQAFGELLLDAVKHWQYAPALLGGSTVKAPVFLIVLSREGKLNSRLEMNPAFPTKPKIPLENQIADGTLFKINSRAEHFKTDTEAVHPPKALFQPDPGYSEAARVAKLEGILVLGMIIGRDGNPEDVWVVKKLGLGLDQKAIEMVQNWQFRPQRKLDNRLLCLSMLK